MLKLKVISFIIIICLSFKSSAQVKNTKLKLFGDIRNRIENDWDSQKQDGTMRKDRSRLRLRFRFGFEYNYNSILQLGGRIRTGNPLGTQSPHTDYGNELIPKSLVLDKAYVKVKWHKGYFWAGKNSYPFWKQNEMFWDDDATPEGMAVSHTLYACNKNSIKLIGGYFLLDNSSSNSFNDKAKFWQTQAVFNFYLNNFNLQTAIGYLSFKENNSQPDLRLLDLNYHLVQTGTNISFPFIRGKNIKLGIDISYNLFDYKNSIYNKNQKTGYVGSIKYGNLNSSGNFLIGYYYAHIEKYAVVPGYAQDDWVRWGSSTVARSSNFQGHEFRIAYAFAKSHNIVIRLYLVNGIMPEKNQVQLESGKRLRIDWNLGF